MASEEIVIPLLRGKPKSAMASTSVSSSIVPPPQSQSHPAHPDLSSTDPSLWPQGSSSLKDASVQGTSDDAATSKTSAMQLGYFSDEFLEYFVPPQHQARRPPLINRGYWARVAAVTQIIHEFLVTGENEQRDQDATSSSSAAAATPSNSIPPTSPFYRPPTTIPPPFPSVGPARIRKQIVSLGAGSDTNYFKLKSCGRAPLRYVEVDFPVAVEKKAAIIRRTPRMMELVQAKSPQQTDADREKYAKGAEEAKDHIDPILQLPSHDYALVGADLRNLEALEAGLRHAQVDFSLPTLILSECVLIYMMPGDSAKLLSFLTSHFTGGAAIWTYEQIHPFDAFGSTMRQNLDNRGCSLLGFTAYPDLIAQRQRYLAAGFDYYAGWDMNDIYRYCLGPLSEVKRIERLELFDEFEEWNMIQAHYHISLATIKPKDGKQLNESSDSSTSSSSTSAAPSAVIPWSSLGILGKSKSHSAVNTHSVDGKIVTSTGRTVLLGGAGLRASAPLTPKEHIHPAKGSLKKPTN